MNARIPLITGLIASLAFAGAQQASAADRGDVAAGVAVGAILGGVLASRPVRVYEPAPVYAPPPVVYYEPRPVYYEPRPVYYPAPVYYGPGPYRHKHWRKHHHHDHGGYRW